jgi:hypothetical protein
MPKQDDLAARVRRLEDKEEIVELMHSFAAAMDVQDWDLLRSVFAPDIAVDHTAEHWNRGKVVEVQKGLDEVMRVMKAGVSRHFVSHHIITNHRIVVDGDRARASCYLHSVHVDDPQRPTEHDDHGAWYIVELARTPKGWKMEYLKHTSLWNAEKMKALGPVTKPDIAEFRDHLRPAKARPRKRAAAKAR